MSKRGSENICLLCKWGFRPRATRQTASPFARKLRTSANRTENGKDGAPKKLFFTPAELRQQLELSSAADVLRRVMLGPRAVNRSRSINQRISAEFSKISRNSAKQRSSDWTGKPSSDSDEVLLRERLNQHLRSSIGAKGASVEAMTELLRFQIKACTCAEDVVRVITTALGPPDGKDARARAKLVANPSLHESIKQRIAQWDPEANLALLGLLISRMETRGQEVSQVLVYDALKAAAVTHSLAAFKRYFKLWQDHNESTGAKFEKGRFMKLLLLLRQGFEHGASSNFDRRRQGILEILFGSGDSTAREHNLSSYLPVDEFQVLKLWLALLADCKARDQIWNEWELVKKGNRWNRGDTEANQMAKSERHRASLFILALFRADDPHRAWLVFEDIDHLMGPGQPVGTEETSDDATSATLIHTSVWDALIAHLDAKPVLNQRLQQALHQTIFARLENLMSIIEKQLCVTWREPSGTSAGFHILQTPMETQTEELDELDQTDAGTDVLADFQQQIDAAFAGREGPSSLRDLDWYALNMDVKKAPRASRVDRDVLDTLVSAVGRKSAASGSPPDSPTTGARQSHSKGFAGQKANGADEAGSLANEELDS